MLVHIVIVVLLTGLAMAKTGSTDPGRWQHILRYRVSDVYYGSCLYLLLNTHCQGFKLYATFAVHYFNTLFIFINCNIAIHDYLHCIDFMNCTKSMSYNFVSTYFGVDFAEVLKVNCIFFDFVLRDS